MTNIELVEEVERQAASMPAVHLSREQEQQLRAMTHNSGMSMFDCGWDAEPVYHGKAFGHPDFSRGIRGYRILNSHARKAAHAARVYLTQHIAKTLTK